MIKAASADDYDPQGDPPEENSENAPNVIDGDPATDWTTSDYKQNFGPGGIKDGVGVLLDLGKGQTVGQVEIDFGSAPTDVSVYLSDQSPSGVPTGDPAAEGTADKRRLTLSLPDDASGRYLLVWLTSIPPAGGDFRGEIREISVRS